MCFQRKGSNPEVVCACIGETACIQMDVFDATLKYLCGTQIMDVESSVS